jgi:hypothetical protein
VPQIRGERRDPRPVLRRRVHSLRRVRLGAVPAARAFHLDQLVLGDLRLHRRDLGHLPPLCPGLPGSLQPGAAVAAGRWHMPEHVIMMIGQPHGHARLAPGPARPAPGLRPQRLRHRPAQPVRGRRRGRILRVLPRLRRQLGNLRLKAGYSTHGRGAAARRRQAPGPQPTRPDPASPGPSCPPGSPMLNTTGLPVSSSSSARSRPASAPPWPDTTPGRAASISTRT